MLKELAESFLDPSMTGGIGGEQVGKARVLGDCPGALATYSPGRHQEVTFSSPHPGDSVFRPFGPDLERNFFRFFGSVAYLRPNEAGFKKSRPPATLRLRNPGWRVPRPGIPGLAVSYSRPVLDCTYPVDYAREWRKADN